MARKYEFGGLGTAGCGRGGRRGGIRAGPAAGTGIGGGRTRERPPRALLSAVALLLLLLALLLPLFLGGLLRRFLLVLLGVVRFGHVGYLEVDARRRLNAIVSGILFHLGVPEQELLALAWAVVLTSRPIQRCSGDFEAS